MKPRDVLQLFVRLYKEKYGREVPMLEEGSSAGKYATTYVYIGRAIKWSKIVTEVMDVVRFMFVNWEEIKAGMGLDGPPTFNLVGSAKVWPRLVSCMTDGIPKPRTVKGEIVARRADTSRDEKALGW